MRVIITSLLLLLAIAGPSYAAPPPPPVGTDVDYQLGGPTEPAPNVGIVARDRTEEPAAGRYNICYVNGYQSQPGASGFWLQRRDLLLEERGRIVQDEEWGEWLFDIRTREKREQLVRIIGAWAEGCARKGFDAVEFDNLDSFTRSHGLLRARQAKAFARLLIARSHKSGLAVGQKNWSTWNGTRVGFDFVIAEECGRYDECDQYVKHFGDHAIVIEYRDRDFAKTCREYGDRLAVVRRDRALSPHGVRRWC